MILAAVEGQVWGAKQAECLSGRRLLVVRPLRVKPLPAQGRLAAAEATISEGPARRLVVVDGLGAGPGELVLVAHGSRCRDLTAGQTVPAKDVVIAIVDGGDFDCGAARGGRR